jgi:HNH endonuclease
VKRPILERLKARSVLDPQTGCVRWTGAHNQKGYGRISYLGRLRQVHRLIYELLVEPIPPGLTVDHVCGTKACINVRHMQLVSREENSRLAHERRRLTRTHCRRGHEVNAESVAVKSRTWTTTRTRTGQARTFSYTVHECRRCPAAWRAERRARRHEGVTQ